MRGAALIVLAWNQWPTTRRCLDSLFESDLDHAQVIVVDNGSEDETAQALAAYASRVRIVRHAQNLGFVRGMNAGIAAARADDDVVLLNNDLVFRQRDWLNRLRDAAYSHAENGIVGCRMRGGEDDPRLYHLGGFIDAHTLLGQQTESGIQETEVGQFTRTRRVQGIAFALAYIRRDCLTRIGVLDEIFHSYYEDTDYCLRAADAGIACVMAGNVTLQHAQHGSTRDDGGFRERLRTQSRTAFAKRWQARLLDQQRGTVHWQGVTRQPHAFAQLTRSLVWRLDARDLHMTYSALAPELTDAQDIRLQMAAQRHMPAVPEVSFFCAPPEMGIRPQGRFRVAFCMAECDRAPPIWATRSHEFDLLLVADEFQKSALSAAGVEIPIGILPLGVDQDYAHPDVPSVRNPDRRFVFLAFAEDLRRDAPDRVVAAFRRAFCAQDDVELILHVAPGDDQARIRERVESLLAEHQGAVVRVLADTGFPAYQRMQLMCAADCYVSARRGAGWDSLAAEAVACGRMLLAPAWGSQQALVQGFGLAVAHRMVPSNEPGHGQRWAEADADSLIAQMRAASEGRQILLANARHKAARFARENSLDASADALARWLASGATLKPARTLPAPHRPQDLNLAVSGQMVILGMHRSGTSSVGGLLKLLGAWPGEDERLLRGADNPRGHFELADLHMACVRRLQAVGADWRNPLAESSAAATDAFRREAALILQTLESRRPWFIKEPRLCLLARELLPLLTRPVFLHVIRDPVAVAASLAKRDGMPADEALALWEHYTREAFAASDGWPRLTIDYDALRSNPIAVTRKLHCELAALGIAGLHLPSDAAIGEWIRPDANTPGPFTASLSASQHALLEAIRSGSILERA